LLVDSTPGSRAGADDFLDAALASGRTLRDPISGMSITTNGIGFGLAQFTVTVP
jgi:hypothetical protein